MSETTPQQLRENIMILQKAFEAFDGITEALAENRIKLEALVRMPELGRSERGVLEPKVLREHIEKSRKQQQMHQDIVLQVSGAETLDEARELTLTLLSAFQRVNQLRELSRLVDLGYPSAIKEAREEYKAPDAAIESLRPRIATDLRIAKDVLESAAADVVVPPAPILDRVTPGSIFRQ